MQGDLLLLKQLYLYQTIVRRRLDKSVHIFELSQYIQGARHRDCARRLSSSREPLGWRSFACFLSHPSATSPYEVIIVLVFLLPGRVLSILFRQPFLSLLLP